MLRLHAWSYVRMCSSACCCCRKRPIHLTVLSAFMLSMDMHGDTGHDECFALQCHMHIERAAWSTTQWHALNHVSPLKSPSTTMDCPATSEHV